ncbi:MAG TPA: ATP-binding protein [Gemmatimonadaceae bacterium]
MHRIAASVRSLNLATLGQGLCVLTLVLLLAPPSAHAVSTIAPRVLLLVQVVCAIAVSIRAAHTTTGTRRTLFAALAAAGLLAIVSGSAWALRSAFTGAPTPATVDVYAGLGAQLMMMLGFATALGRYRHRNWMHFEAVVDAMLLVLAAAIVIVQLGDAPARNSGLGLGMRVLVVAWDTAAAGNLILIALLLSWRGEALGERVATGLAFGTVALAIANLLFAHDVLVGRQGITAPITALWAITVFAWISAADTSRVVEPAQSGELPAYASGAATIRTVSIVVAIFIAAGSILAMTLRGDASMPLGITLSLFAVLLGVRAGYALWAQQRTTVVLEHTVLAERELSVTLEHRVAERTRDVAEAQRVMQRMWTLGQQIALELQPERVLRCYMDAVIDVARADGGVVALVSDDTQLRIAATAGIGDALAGGTMPLASSFLGRAVRRGASWCAADLPTSAEESGAEHRALAAAGAHGIAIVPLQRRGEVIGAAMVLSRLPRSFKERELAHIEAMTDLLSVALANADLVETLRQAEWRFRTLFRAAPDAVLTVFDSGRIREANDAVRDLVGLQPLQLVGCTIDEFVIPEDRDRLRAELARALAGASSRIEVRFRHELGIRVGSLALRRLPEADPPMVLVVGRDMTAEREMRARLAETERLAAVGELVAGVAHEVNNPLSTISAYAQLLLRDAGLDADHHESVEVIRSETVRASQVLSDLLTFARRSETEPRPLVLNEVVERTVRLRSYEMSTAGITCETELASDLPAVTGDARQLQQVLLNLMTNAIQAMAPQGSGTLRIVTRADADRVVLEVRDTGPGIAPEARAHVFEPFFTTKRDGTGLGLSVSYGIIATHGGSITIARTSSDGTMFRVSLPAYIRDAVPDDEDDGLLAPDGRDESTLKGIRLLFVDDEPTLRSGMQAFGRLRRIAVVTASDGAAALKAVRTERFDAVVCDLRMPVMDGPAFYEVLRREDPTLAARTLFVTGDLVSASSRAFLDTTTQPVLSKPFEFEQLEANLLALLHGDACRTSLAS